jgi:hypothetical protein
MLFGALEDKLYYSDIALPYAWPATNFIDFADTITGIGPVQNGIMVFTKFETYIVTGNSPDTFTKYLIDSSQGCESHYSISFVSNTLVWLSQDGLCASSGGAITIITANSLGKLTLAGVNNSQVFDKVYYLSHENGILCYDFRYNTLVRTMDTTIDWLGSYKDGLWASVDGQLKTMLEGEALTYTYKSPMLTEGMYSNLKVYKDFYIKYNGDVTLNLYVDKALVNTKVLTGDTCYNLKALASAHGYGLEIELIGTAEVSEIQFIAEGRQNGR